MQRERVSMVRAIPHLMHILNFAITKMIQSPSSPIVVGNFELGVISFFLYAP